MIRKKVGIFCADAKINFDKNYTVTNNFIDYADCSNREETYEDLNKIGDLALKYIKENEQNNKDIFYKYIYSLGAWYQIRQELLETSDACYNFALDIQKKIEQNKIKSKSLTKEEFGYFVKEANQIKIPCETLNSNENKFFNCEYMSNNFLYNLESDNKKDEVFTVDISSEQILDAFTSVNEACNIALEKGKDDIIKRFSQPEISTNVIEECVDTKCKTIEKSTEIERNASINSISNVKENVINDGASKACKVTFTAEIKIKKNSKIFTENVLKEITDKSKLTSNNSSFELDAVKKRALELERKLAAIEAKQKQEEQKINADTEKPIINAFAKQDGSNAIISGRVTDNTEVAEVLVDGQAQQLKSNGTFETSFYVPRSGKTIEVVAFDIKGNKASKILQLERGDIKSADKQQFKSLDPSLKKVKSNPNALALIIGISDYENTKASALYADSDAKMFYDYANLKLGIPSSNIKELVNDKADRIDITRAIKTWLLKRTVTDKTDIFVFFAGHGLATDDGKDVYLLPYDGVPDLLEDSSIKRKELFADIQATKPRTVTVFLDTCYSGGTRNDETLVASLRPVLVKAKEQAIPSNFTVLSAAQGNQTSQSLEEVKHGLFSYYTMLGMEGGADSNNDNKITAKELHAFIKDKVERQSQFRQTPELQGDKDRVLVQFN